MNEFLQSLSTCGWLIWRDIRAALTDFIANIVDSAIFPIGWLFVDGYIMPYLGVPADYGVFMIAGLAAGMCLNSTATDAGDLIIDLEGPRAVSYELSLPLPSWMLCVKFALVYAIRGVILNILIFPAGALMLWKHINLLTISWPKFLFLFWWINLLYGYFSLVIALWLTTTEGYWQLLFFGLNLEIFQFKTVYCGGKYTCRRCFPTASLPCKKIYGEIMPHIKAVFKHFYR